MVKDVIYGSVRFSFGSAAVGVGSACCIGGILRGLRIHELLDPVLRAFLP